MNKHLSEDPNYRLWILLHQVRDVFHKVREKEVAKYGITATQSAVLFIISANGGEATPTAISNWFLREPHTISSVLTRMEKQGLVNKIRNKERGGELTIRLTEKGNQTYAKTTNIDIIKEMLSCIPEDDRELLRSLLKKLRNKGLKYLFAQKSTIHP